MIFYALFFIQIGRSKSPPVPLISTKPEKIAGLKARPQQFEGSSKKKKKIQNNHYIFLAQQTKQTVLKMSFKSIHQHQGWLLYLIYWDVILVPCLTHTGLPLCITKPKIEDFVPMMKRIENRLLSCSTMLSTGDKLTLIKSVFSSMPIFFMCSLMLPKTVVKQINIYLKQCFWRKYGTQETGSALVSESL